MKNLSELTDYYYKVLYPVLEELEDERKKLKSKILSVGIIYTVIVIVLTSALLQNGQNIDTYIFIGIAYLAIGGIIYKLLIKDYTSKFKTLIIEPLIR